MEVREHRTIQGESPALHGEEHVCKGHLHLVVEEAHALIGQLRHHLLHQREQQPSSGRFAVHALEAEGREAIDGVVAVQEIVGDHGVEQDRRRRDTVLPPRMEQGLLVEGQHPFRLAREKDLQQLPARHRLVEEGVAADELIGLFSVVCEGESRRDDQRQLFSIFMTAGYGFHILQRGELHRFAGRPIRLRFGLLRCGQPGKDTPQPQLFQALPSTGQLAFVEQAVLQLRLHGGDGGDGAQPVAQPGGGFVFPNPFPQLSFDLILMGIYAVQIAVAFQELQGGLLPHAGHAGNIVGGIPHQCLQIPHVIRGKAVGLLQCFRIVFHRVRDALLGEEHMGVICGELQGVPIPRDQQHVQASLFRPPGQGAQDVVRLIGGALHHGDVHLPQEVLQNGHLGPELVRRGPTAGLVFVVFQVTESGPVHVEGHGHMAGLSIHQLEEHAQKAVERARRCAVPAVHGRLEGEERPIHQAVPVDDDKGMVHAHSFTIAYTRGEGPGFS